MMNSAQQDISTMPSVFFAAIRAFSAAVVMGSMAVTFALSFAAILYAGPLAPFLSQGIGLVLIGTIVMALIGPLTMSYRGTLIQPQDVSTIFLSLSAASIAATPGISGASAFSTVVVLVGVASIATGLAAYGMGRMKLGYLVRFIPFPVISGFLAASGALLVRGAFDMVAPGVGGLDGLLAKWPLWLPWLAVAIAITLVARMFSSSMTIPAALVLSLGGFYVVTAAMGLDFAAMEGAGLLLGPFQTNSFAGALTPDLVSDVHWQALLAQLPAIAAIIVISLIGTLLNASGLELAIEREIDFERDLKGVGIANIAAGLFGGLPGYNLLSETLLARRFGIVGVATGVGVAATAALVLFLGGGMLAFLPVGLFAVVIWYLGFDLLLTGIRDHGMLMPRAELVIVLAMPVIALVFGFMPAVGFGITMAVLLFVIAYSGVDVTRLGTTAANFHARVERSPADHARLAELGSCTRIYVLDGFVFFGSASRLVDRIQRQLGGTPGLRFAVIDLKNVVGLDMSAWESFERLGRSCGQLGIELIVTGLCPKLKARFGRLNHKDRMHFRLADELDDVLVEIEQGLLDGTRDAESADGAFQLDAEMETLLRRYGSEVELAAGEELLVEGAQSDHMLFLLRGRLCATVTDRKQTRRVISRFLPGAIVGEIAHYAGGSRTATITAETEATVVRLDAAALAQVELDDPQAAARFHKTLATVLARRLMTTTRLLNDMGL
ncbi:MAG: SulP family inorganic anion transporter [Paracoccaceae bacterium]